MRPAATSTFSRDSVRLPLVDLPTFSGAALGLIDLLPTTETNYSIAYDLLVDRYNNPKLLIQQHTRELFELKAVAFEAAVCLKILEQPVDAWDAILVHLMANKLDSATRREWESAASGAKPPTYEQLEKFNTALGWIVGGKVARVNTGNDVNWFLNERTVNLSIRELTEEEILCEELFVNTTRRSEDGRFVLRLPTKTNIEQLGESRSLALDRLLKLEKRFEKNIKLRTDYTLFMKDYLTSGHMEKIEEDDIDNDKPMFYLPHHAVLKPESKTTKLRTVFNASASTSTGLSLNDVLLSGPTIQQELFSILLRFRSHRYALTGDVKQMFRQMLIHVDDRQLLLILWRFSQEEAVNTYRLNTVTYGTCSAPFAATRCLQQLAIENEERYPEASNVIKTDFYMDDVLTGHDDPERLIQTKNEMSTILKSAGFELHKWKANDPSIVPDDGSTSIVKILGMLWDTRADMFGFRADINMSARTTKRNVLSEVQKIFDPLGILSPIVLHGKLTMQDIWSVKLEWDQELPEQIKNQWKWFCKQVEEINRISIPRYVHSKGCLVELHGFADAAKRAYGAVIYVRTANEEGINVRLLCSKSRIAPSSKKTNTEDTTIPWSYERQLCW
ncbi:uncharacterized protein LOC129729277 [Wyeomyia smithii]|uniref:uncharacterized protein LOC129729277 n=1 Tax=Wyeomyia smithii TaxID=174621 RepID=UPI002467DE0D|nr:uncharacterized protein LOC129729277 [Wyeomyia smithii]